MLDHDELLPEEQAHPALVQELQTIYLMKSEEQQVLSRVHQRLAETRKSILYGNFGECAPGREARHCPPLYGNSMLNRFSKMHKRRRPANPPAISEVGKTSGESALMQGLSSSN